MWTLNDIDVARWQVGVWKLRITADADSLSMFVSRDGSHESRGEIGFLGRQLPQVREMYVRGNELHLVLPQESHEDASEGFETIAGLEFVILPISADTDALVVETTLSLQTQWLDVEPTVVIRLPTEVNTTRQNLHSLGVIAPPKVFSSLGDHAPAVSLIIDERDLTSLVPPSLPCQQIEFFGDFMEKGVIRKVQPWWIWTASPLSESRIEEWSAQLSNRPLPLAG